MFKSFKMMFLFSLIISSLISISSYSWIGMWMGLEINLLSIIPLMNNSNNSMASEASLKYFITQALASTIFLFSIILISSNFVIFKNIINPLMIIFNSALLTKMGAAPFHFWFPEVMEGLSWINCLLLLTWQKIAPMILLLHNLNSLMFLFSVIMFSMLISGIMGLNQTSLRKIMAYSSINHIAWMLSSMFTQEIIWIIYFFIYTMISINIILIFMKFNIFYIKQLFISMNNNLMFKFFFMFNFLSLGGLPPFIGFFPKWLIIQNLINNHMFFMTFLMIMLTLMTLFYYIRLIFSMLIINMNEIKIFNKNTNKFWILMSNFMSILSLTFCTILFNYF